MSFLSQAGLMVRANLFRQTGAKVELAARHYSSPRFASAMTALSNRRQAFADTCCRRPVSYLKARDWATRTAALSVRLASGMEKTDSAEYRQKHAEAFREQLVKVVELMGDRGQLGNVYGLGVLIGQTPIAEAHPAHPVAGPPEHLLGHGTAAGAGDAHGTMPPPVVLTFESRCKHLADRVWSGCIATYDQFDREMQDVAASAAVRTKQTQDAAHARCLQTFMVIEYIRQRTPHALALSSTQAASWGQWSARAEREAVAAFGLGKDAGCPGTPPSPAPAAVPVEQRQTADALAESEGFWI